MKYLFINSVAGYGSTGKIVLSACRGLEQQGHTCRIAYGRRCTDNSVPTMAIGNVWDYRLHALRHRVFGTGGFGSKTATTRFLRRVRDYDPDVIWLHNLHGYYIHVGLLFDYLRTCGKKIIWTLHDCWAFTGNCPYFTIAGCDKWKRCCGGCPQKGSYPKALLDATGKNYLRKKELFTGIPDLTLEVPSQWLADLVRESFLKDYPIRVVPNQVDSSVFKPTSGDFRKLWNLEDAFLVLGVANVWEPRKGLADFIQLATLLPAQCRIVLIGLSSAQMQGLPANILGLPRTGSAPELAEIYTTADVYVCPSLEETFGMTVLEAASCGTTPVVYENTACQEVAAAHGGISVPPGAEHLAKAILEILERKQEEA